MLGFFWKLRRRRGLLFWGGRIQSALHSCTAVLALLLDAQWRLDHRLHSPSPLPLSEARIGEALEGGRGTQLALLHFSWNRFSFLCFFPWDLFWGMRAKMRKIKLIFGLGLNFTALRRRGRRPLGNLPCDIFLAGMKEDYSTCFLHQICTATRCALSEIFVEDTRPFPP